MTPCVSGGLHRISLALVRQMKWSTPSVWAASPQKPNGGVRGIVVGDIIRRLVARTIAQQFSSTVEQATAPFQYALSTKAGGECIAHALQALTDLNPRTTVLSVDGVGASDLISRGSILEGLRSIPGLCASFRPSVLRQSFIIFMGRRFWGHPRNPPRRRRRARRSSHAFALCVGPAQSPSFSPVQPLGGRTPPRFPR